MKTSMETINGKLFTIVWHGDNSGKSTLGRRIVALSGGVFAVFKDADCLDHIATALPALPRHPKPEDAKLLYRYMSEGIAIHGAVIDGSEAFVGLTEINDYPVMTFTNGRAWWFVNKKDSLDVSFSPKEITHATDMETGERAGVAIDGESA